MKIVRDIMEEQRGQESKTCDRVLNRRNFLKMVGAVVGSGAVLNSRPISGSTASLDTLARGSFLSNPGEDYWRLVRQQFCLRDDLIHMNTGTLSSISTHVRDELFYHFQNIAENPYPTPYYAPYDLAETHQKAAAFLGADADEIIVTGCTTEGMSFVAMGLDLEAGDEVLTTMHDHPGGLGCWRILRDRRGITLTEMPFQESYNSKDEIVNLFASKITSKTKVMSFCHINYVSGLTLPVKELCQLASAHNIITVIDGAHAIGMFNLDLHDMGCDFYACSPQKWLCAPPGVGVLYAKRDKQSLIWPTVTESYKGQGVNLQSQLENRGQRSSPVLVCLKDAMDFQDTIKATVGQDGIANRILALSAYAKARLMQIPGVSVDCSTKPEMSSGLTKFHIKNIYQSHAAINSKIRGDTNILMRTVYYKNYPSEAKDRTGLRISTHIYNNYDQIDLLARAIEENLGMM